MTLLKELAYSTLLCFTEDLFHLSHLYSLVFPKNLQSFISYHIFSWVRPQGQHSHILGKSFLCTAQKEPQPLKNLGKTEVAMYKPIWHKSAVWEMSGQK